MRETMDATDLILRIALLATSLGILGVALWARLGHATRVVVVEPIRLV